MKKTAPIIKTEEINYYIKDLKKIPVISHERENEIFSQLKDEILTKSERQKLIDEVVKGNLRFVISIAKGYQNQGLDVSDLISEGNIGLIKAIERYDISSGEAQKLKKAEASQEDSFYVEYSEIPLTGIPTTIDLFREINEEGDTLLEIIANPNAVSPEDLANSTVDLKHRIKYMMSFLDERESAIIEGYFGLTGTEKNLDDLGEEFGCTKERIRQLKDKAIKKLRNESFSLLKYL